MSSLRVAGATPFATQTRPVHFDRLLGLVCATLMLSTASCGSPASKHKRDPAQPTNSTGAAGDSQTGFFLESADFKNGGPIPVRYTCDGLNVPPHLRWGAPPQGTLSLAITVDDPDAPGGTFRHWGVFNISPTARSSDSAAKALTDSVNDFGRRGYSGPCPPKSGGAHHYRFTLFALDTQRLEVAGPKVADIESAAEKHALGRAMLVGTYERQ